MICMVVLAFSSIATRAAGENVWVSSSRAELKAASQASSRTIRKLDKGARLQVVLMDGRWYQVRTANGESGWVYRGKVSSKPPAGTEPDGGGGSLGELLGDLSGSSIQADKATTSRSIRGLSPEAQEYARQTGAPKAYQQALDKVFAVKVKDEEIESFLEKGRIGEYAK